MQFRIVPDSDLFRRRCRHLALAGAAFSGLFWHGEIAAIRIWTAERRPLGACRGRVVRDHVRCGRI